VSSQIIAEEIAQLETVEPVIVDLTRILQTSLQYVVEYHGTKTVANALSCGSAWATQIIWHQVGLLELLIEEASQDLISVSVATR
jgi:hypothetical protein